MSGYGWEGLESAVCFLPLALQWGKLLLGASVVNLVESDLGKSFQRSGMSFLGQVQQYYNSKARKENPI